MTGRGTTILEKTMEAGRALMIAGVVLALIGGAVMATGAAWLGWALGVVAVAAFLYGLVIMHAATAEALARARTTDMRGVGSDQPDDAR